MSKEVVARIKLQITAKQASPAPPVGPALGQHGVNIMQFVREFNDRTGKMEEGVVVPVLITVFKDKTFNFIMRTPPASYLLKKAAGIAKGSGAPNKDKVGQVTQKQIEEIARIYGYDNIPITVPASFTKGRLSEDKAREQTLRSDLSGLGLSEVYSWAMIDPAVFDHLGLPEDHHWRNAPRIMNPMSTEQSIMRPSLLPGMLEIASYNARRRQPDLRLFEIGRVFGTLPSGGQELPEEDVVLGLITCGRNLPVNWRNAGLMADFFEMKGLIEALLKQSGVRRVIFEPAELPAMHPGRTARIAAGKVEVGYFGEIHPEICSRYDLPETYFAQLNLGRLFSVGTGITYQPLPKFPDVERDIALLVPESVPAARVTECVLKAGGELLEQIRLFDVYQGEQIADGWRSLAYSLSFRHPERTLTEAEIGRAHV